MSQACVASVLFETSDASRSHAESMEPNKFKEPIPFLIQSPLIACRDVRRAEGPGLVLRRFLIVGLALASGLVIGFLVRPHPFSLTSLIVNSKAINSHSENTQPFSKDALRQQRIANAIAFTFARELDHWSSSAVHEIHKTHRVQKLEFNTTTATNESSKVPSAVESSQANRGREGPRQPVPSSGPEISADGSPGFEESWVGVPSTGTDIPQGLAGSNTFVLDDVEELEQDFLDTWNDKSIAQIPSQPETASNKFFPFGRDEIVEVQPGSNAAPADFDSKPESFSGSGLLSDEEEPNDEEAALRVTDVYVTVPAAVPASAQQEGSDNGVAAVFPDELVPQDTVAAQPRGHREHTDFDLQGSVPDLLVPASDYDAGLGEDVSPAGLQDAAVHVPPPRSLAAQPRLGEASVVPAAWGDRYVTSGGDVATDDGRVTNPEAAAAGDWAAARDAAAGWDFAAALARAARAALEDAGVDAADVEGPPQPETVTADSDEA